MTTLTSVQLRKALSIREKLDDLETELAGLFGGASGQAKAATRGAAWTRPGRQTTMVVAKSGKRKPMSAAGRAKIAAAARKRWKLAKAAGKTTLGG